MNIAIYVSELDIRGGTHKQVLRLAQFLRASQHNVLIVTSLYVPGHGYPEFADFPILTLSGETRTSLLGKLFKRLRAVQLAIRMPEVDVVNVHDNGGVMFGLLAKILGKGKRYVWQINDLHPAFQIGAHKQYARSSIRQMVQRMANRWWASRVDAITVNVGKNRTRVQEFLRKDATVLFCGVDFPTTEFSILTCTSPFRLLSTGVFFPYRNYETLVKASALANERLGTTVDLTIIGDTRYNPEYANKIRNLAIKSKVALTIRENLSEEELDREIAESHAFAFINVDQSWGLAVFEVAARATPVILSTNVGASELLDGRPGFLMVDPLSSEDVANAIIALATDSRLLELTAKMARDTVKEMSWARLYCAPAETLFERLLNK